MKLGLLFSLVLLLSCTTRHTNREHVNTSVKSTIPKQAILSDSISSNTEIIEIFIDSLNIGKKGQSKIELIKHRVLDDMYVIVKFYTKGPRYWYLQNTYLYECNVSMDLEPIISDFNNDKFNDITFVSAQAARLSNDVRRLFIYDDREKQLISIVNSEDYPNMLYNKELNCIDAFLIYGGSSTVFARIEGDSLKTFASVNNDIYRTVYEIDNSGKETLLRKDSIDPEDNYIRYINYKPLKKYK
ncbi:MAG: hypothetical protein JST70_11470 [Bacteroidetes bacterium]|nr:hypothetical protein [Bacteroidota bacterium]